MAQVNIKEMTGRLNQLRVNNQDKLYTRPQILEDLKGLGFSSQISQAILTLVSSRKEGKHCFYQFGKDPIHFSKLNEIYQRFRDYGRKSKSKAKSVAKPFNQQEAIQQLQAAGYQIRKCVGFDEARFKSENPELYQKYLKYEDL